MLDIMDTLIVLATMLTPLAHAHSWVEELTLLAPNGSFTGPRGYPRGMVQRTASFTDEMMEWQLPTGNGNTITSSMSICRPSQQTANYTAGNPILQAPAGSSIALRYQENGHVTQPWIPYGKPQGSGAVYIYGTTQPSEDDTLVDIYQNWTLDGTGGDGRGRLLTSQFFDDSQCYQISEAPKSVERQQEFPRKAEAGSVEGANLWCQTDVKLPSDLSVGTEYTLYWVWDWSTLKTSGSVAQPQFYTTCMDVEISAAESEEESVPFATITNYGEAAISSVFEGLTAAVTVPATLTPGYFTSEAMDTSTTSTSTSTSTSTGLTTTSTSTSATLSASVREVMGVPAAALQATSACSTVTITTTETVTATVTSTVT
jgi:hypothetical protein